MPRDLDGAVALVAGATRGAGRGIAVELGARGATVYCTGRTTRAQQSPMRRPETIEETAELVDAAGGRGIAVRVDHTSTDEVAALVARIAEEQDGRLDVLVNSLWGGDPLTGWGMRFWEHSLADGLEIQRHAVTAHLVTAWHALPLMVARGRGLVVEMTDGDGTRYEGQLFYDIAKTANRRIAHDLAVDLRSHGVTAVAVAPGFLRSEAMLDHFGVTEADLARRDRNGRALRPVRDASVRRPRDRGARCRSGRGALQRPDPALRRARTGVRDRGRRRAAPRLGRLLRHARSLTRTPYGCASVLSTTPVRM